MPTPSSSGLIHLAAYLFVPLQELETLKERVLTLAKTFAIKGTILLAPEGINLFICASKASAVGFLNELKTDSRFSALTPRETITEGESFKRLKVKIKREIITYGVPQTTPVDTRANAVSPQTVARWIAQGKDDNGRAVAMLDTRNDFEVDAGTFKGAMDWRIRKFSDFGEQAQDHLVELKDKTVVAFCTGGIRCEKAVLHMQQLGYPNVFQLDGGVLGYFEQVGKTHWNGELFVFDDRVGVTDAHSVKSPASKA